MHTLPPPAPVWFGEARWDRTIRRLTVRGETVTLPHRAGLCLDVLIARAPDPVSREALLQSVWDGSIVEDSNLSHAMLALRKALDPGPDGASYIETVPRLGYRLVPPIRLQETLNDETSPVAAPIDTQQAVPGASLAPSRRWWITAAAAAVIVLGATFAGRAMVVRRQAQVEAGERVQTGFRLLRRSNLEDAAAATAEFDRALTLAAGLPAARAGLAEASARLGQDSFSLAIDLARSALAADRTCAECRSVLGYILMTRAWNWTESRQLLDQALRDAPQNAQARVWSSLWFAVHGRLAEAGTEANAAIAIEPANAQAHAQLASVHYLAGRYADALTAAEHASQLNPKLQVAHYWRARTLMITGPASDVAVARADEMAAWQTFSQDHRMALMNQYSALALSGGASKLADFWLAEVAEGRPRAVNQYERAVWQMWSGRQVLAIDELAAAVRTRPYRVIYTAADPIFRPLRSNSRFADVLRGLGLPALPPS